MGCEEINGVEIRYREFGQKGPMVFMLHGFGGGPMDFHGSIQFLKDSCRVIVPNLKIFFSNDEPLSYTQQVEIVQKFIQSRLETENQKIHLVGVSYGATLSLGVRSEMNDQVISHTIVNPMPFDPLEKLRNHFLKLMMNFYYIPGGLTVFLKTPVGQKTLRALGKVFHMGLRGQDRLKYFNVRKLNLIEKALRRFMWVAHNENWSFWFQKTKGQMPCLVLYSTKDSLFSADDYEKFIDHLGRCRIRPISDKGHRLVITHAEVVGKAVAKNIAKAIKKHKTDLHTA